MLSYDLSELVKKAERQEEKIQKLLKENILLKATLADGTGPCYYCNLPRESLDTCSADFCRRKDDIFIYSSIMEEEEKSKS